MSTDHDLAAARVIQELAAFADPPADLPAARLELRRRTRQVVVRRRLALGAIAVAAAAVVGFVIFQGLPQPHSTLPPAKQLHSGLPIGTLEGKVDFRGVVAGRRVVQFVVRADGTGTYRQPNGNSADVWPVRYVGAAPGRVTLKRTARWCSKDDNELTLDFTVRGDTVTITRATTGECSAFPGKALVDLRGVILRVQHGPRP